MVWKTLTDGLRHALEKQGLDAASALSRLELAVPRDPAHGDWTTNLALLLAKDAGQPPRRIAETLAASFPLGSGPFAAVEVAGPGFLNFRYADAFLAGLPARIVSDGPAFGRHPHVDGTPVLVEYVSANPTGPLNVVSARAAAVGASLVRLLAAIGHRAEGEFYVNDSGNQVDLLGQSVAARFAELHGVTRAFPEQGYQGDYLRDVARALDPAAGRAALASGDDGWFRAQALERMLAWQRADLEAYGAEFARWYRESTLHGTGAVEATFGELESRGATYRAVHPESGYARGVGGKAEGEATWLRTSGFGDGQDRVIRRSSGVPTYLLPDIAYHRDKRARGYRHAVNLLGPDHHEYAGTLKAALSTLGVEPDFLEVLIVQQVNLMSGGAQVKMSKRAGEFVTLRDLMDDVGADCAKFFFLMRSTSAHLDFDLDLARRRNDENPAYYVQYAHARVCSILRYGNEQGLAPASGPVRLEAPEETALVRRLATWPEVVRGAAFAREPHRIPTCLMELAAEFHRFYHACRVVTDDAARSRERLCVVEAARTVIANGLGLMGVTAPERMERAAEVAS